MHVWLQGYLIDIITNLSTDRILNDKAFKSF